MGEYELRVEVLNPRENKRDFVLIIEKIRKGKEEPRRVAANVECKYVRYADPLFDCWNLELSEFEEDKEFFKKYGRHALDEISIHLAKWRKKMGASIEYPSYAPKRFMHPSCADKEPIFKTPDKLLKMKKPYYHPKAARISGWGASFKKWFHGRRPR